MKKLAFTLLLAASFILYACKKEKQEPAPPFQPIDYTVLPPETQTGANTFGCKVNGEVWVPRVPLLAVTYRDIDATVWEKNNSGAGAIYCNLVDIEDAIDNELVLTFGYTDFKAINLYDDEIFIRYKSTSGKYYRSDFNLISGNKVTLTKIDTINNIISGSFSATLYKDSTSLNDKIIITDGRFDLKYTPQ